MRVLAGDTLGVAERDRLHRAVANAEAVSGVKFALFVGEVGGDPRTQANRLHQRLPDPNRSVLVLCDPEERALEIVTGADTRRRLDDWACALAAASMQSSFAGGDLVGGLVNGISQLGEAARAPRTLHSGH
ncbi:MAG: DUF5130 family protein [Actinomycetes bacterium]